MEPVKIYKCQDEDCQKTILENERLRVFRNPDRYKCPHCRGELLEIDIEQKPKE